MKYFDNLRFLLPLCAGACFACDLGTETPAYRCRYRGICPDASNIDNMDLGADSGLDVSRTINPDPDSGIDSVALHFDGDGNGEEDFCYLLASDEAHIWHRQDFEVRVSVSVRCPRADPLPITNLRVLWSDPEEEDRTLACLVPREVYRGMPQIFTLHIRGENPGPHLGRVIIENLRTGEPVGGDNVLYVLGAGDAAAPDDLTLGLQNGVPFDENKLVVYTRDFVIENGISFGILGACVFTGVACVAVPLAGVDIFLSILERGVENSPDLNREQKNARLILINDIRFGLGILAIYSAVGKIWIPAEEVITYASRIRDPASINRFIDRASPWLRTAGGTYRAVESGERMPPGRLAFLVESRIVHCPFGTCCDDVSVTFLDDLYLFVNGGPDYFGCRDGSAVCRNDGNTLLRCDDGFSVSVPCRNCSCHGSDAVNCHCDPEPVELPTDLDEDGFGVDAGDCDDADPNTYPGALEVCDGADNDCDRETDEFSDIGVIWCDNGRCRRSFPRCVAGHEQICAADFDCGGIIDDPAEVCNGRDDNDNGRADETFECTLGLTGSCITSCSSIGTRLCILDRFGIRCAWSTCNPPSEVCNSRDDDCDGERDNGGVCDAPPPPPEECECVRGTTGPCTTTCGSVGTRTCQDDCRWGSACAPPAEVCNSLDDDCNGEPDNGLACGPALCTCGVDCDALSCAHCECCPVDEQCNGMERQRCEFGVWRNFSTCDDAKCLDLGLGNHARGCLDRGNYTICDCIWI